MNKQRFLKKLGSRIREVRQAKGFSQSDLAHHSGKDPQSVERVENGKVNPSAFYLYELAQTLGVKPSEFFRFD